MDINNRFYIGDGREETVRAFLEKCDSPSTGGFYDNGEWFVFVDNIALIIHGSMKLEKLKSALEKYTKGKPKHGSCSADFEGLTGIFDKAIKDVEKIEMYEGELKKNIEYKVNEAVLHELSIHGYGQLKHDHFLASINFDKGIDRQEVIDLIKKYGIEYVSLFLGKDMTTVERIFFEEVEKHQSGILALYEELKSAGLKMKTGYTRKQYPVVFGMDDITFEDEQKPWLDPKGRTKMFNRPV